MKVLELFCGTKSVEKAFHTMDPNHEVISVDIDKKFKPTILCDIMDLDYKQWQPGHFDVVWASPPCTYYSTMQRFSPRSKEFKQQKLEESNEIVKHTLDIIDYLKPKYWFMENPQTGTLKNQEFMQDLPWVDATYCMYGYDYRKQTRFWTNRADDVNLQICSRSKKGKHCDNWENGRHKFAISHTTKSLGYEVDVSRQKDRYSIPEPLLLKLFEGMN